MEKQLGTWWRDNKRHFDSYGMKFVDVISGYAGDPDGIHERLRPGMSRLRCETKAKLKRSIASNGRKNPWEMMSVRIIVPSLTDSYWNSHARFLEA